MRSAVQCSAVSEVGACVGGRGRGTERYGCSQVREAIMAAGIERHTHRERAPAFAGSTQSQSSTVFQSLQQVEVRAASKSRVAGGNLKVAVALRVIRSALALPSLTVHTLPYL